MGKHSHVTGSSNNMMHNVKKVRLESSIGGKSSNGSGVAFSPSSFSSMLYNDYNGLAVDLEDSLALSSMKDYEREAELARRHEKCVL